MHLAQRSIVIEIIWKFVCLRARIRDEAIVVQVLGNLHNLLGGNAQHSIQALLHLNRVQGMRWPTFAFLPVHVDDSGRVGAHAQVVQRRGESTIKQPSAAPFKLRRCAFARMRTLDGPEIFAHVRINVPLPLHDETECRKLTRPVRHDRFAFIVYRQPHACALQRQRIESRKRRAESQIQLHAHIHRLRLVFVRFHEIHQRSIGIAPTQRRKPRSKRSDAPIRFSTRREHLKRDILSLAIAIQP